MLGESQVVLVQGSVYKECTIENNNRKKFREERRINEKEEDDKKIKINEGGCMLLEVGIFF